MFYWIGYSHDRETLRDMNTCVKLVLSTDGLYLMKHIELNGLLYFAKRNETKRNIPKRTEKKIANYILRNEPKRTETNRNIPKRTETNRKKKLPIIFCETNRNIPKRTETNRKKNGQLYFANRNEPKFTETNRNIPKRTEMNQNKASKRLSKARKRLSKLSRYIAGWRRWVS